jgi:hypothetical protein
MTPETTICTTKRFFARDAVFDERSSFKKESERQARGAPKIALVLSCKVRLL